MVPFGAAFQKGVIIRTGQRNVPNYLDELIHMIEVGKIDSSFVITHRERLEDGPRKYRTFQQKDAGCIKVVKRPR